MKVGAHTRSRVTLAKDDSKEDLPPLPTSVKANKKKITNKDVSTKSIPIVVQMVASKDGLKKVIRAHPLADDQLEE